MSRDEIRPEYSDDGGISWYVMRRDGKFPAGGGGRKFRMSWTCEGRCGISPDLPEGFSIVPDGKEEPRCMAHGRAACTYCGRIASGNSDDGGKTCRGCDYWAATGMHSDNCQYRIRGEILTGPEAAGDA